MYTLCTLLIAANAMAATYYVGQSAGGSGDGTSYANRASLAYHNAGSGVFSDVAGDTIVLCGEFEDTLRARTGSSGGIVTYDGNADAYNGSAADAFFDGYDANGTSVYIRDVEYVTLKNIAIDWNVTDTMTDRLSNNFGVKVVGAANIVIDHITIDACDNGMSVTSDTNGLTITNSIFQHIRESGIIMAATDATHYPQNITIGGSYGNGNTFYNNGYKTSWGNNVVAYDVRSSTYCTDIIVSYNEMHSDTPYKMMSAMLFHGSRDVLIERNKMHGNQAYNARAMISIKGGDTETTSSDHKTAKRIIVRFNEIYDVNLAENPYGNTTPSGFTASGNWEDIYIYGNYIRNAGIGVNFNPGRWKSPTTDSDGVDPNRGVAWGNIFTDISSSGFRTIEYSATDTLNHIGCVNNTFWHVATGDNLKTTYAGIGLTTDDATQGDTQIKNNLVISSRENMSSQYGLYSPVSSGDIETDYNCYFSPASVHWGGSSSNCAPCQYNSGDVPNGQGVNDMSFDPEFVHAISGDFRLAEGSQAIAAGTTVSDTDYFPTSNDPITIQNTTFCTDGCDEILSFAYGVDASSTFTQGAYDPIWSARSGSWDLGAVIHGAGGPTPETCTLSDKFELGMLDEGQTYYTDRTYTLTRVPSAYVGMEMITTPNEERNLATDTDYVTFEMPNDGTVYVAYDSRASRVPEWLDGFTDTGDVLLTALSAQPSLKIYSRTYNQGKCVKLGSNKAAGFSGDIISNYVVFY